MIKPRDEVTITNGGQTRTMSWSQLCWEYIGAIHKEKIMRIREELEQTGVSYFIAGDNIGVGIEWEKPK